MPFCHTSEGRHIVTVIEGCHFVTVVRGAILSRFFKGVILSREKRAILSYDKMVRDKVSATRSYYMVGSVSQTLKVTPIDRAIGWADSGV